MKRAIKRLGRLGRRFLCVQQANHWLSQHTKITTLLALKAAIKGGQDASFAALPLVAQIQHFKREVLESLDLTDFQFCGDCGLVISIGGGQAPPVILCYRRFLILGLSRAQARSLAVRSRADLGLPSPP